MVEPEDSRRVNVLVTGGSGLVGRCLQDEVHSSNRSSEFVFVSSKDADLCNAGEAFELFFKYRPKCVIHLAAKVGGLYANLADKDSKLFYNTNQQINENVLKLCYEFKVQRCISCLSTCIFPHQIEYPFDETKIHSGAPHESNRGYALAKRQVDKLNRMYNELIDRCQPDDEPGGRPLFFSVIPTNIYGPYDNFDQHQAHVVASLIRRAYEAFLARSASGVHQDTVVQLQVFGSGKPLRQFVYASDVAKLILKLAQHFEDRREPSVIVCADAADELSISQVTEMICQLFSAKFKTKFEAKFDASKSDGQFRKTAINAKLRRLEPTFEFTPLERGLRMTIDWFCANYPHRVRLTAENQETHSF